MVEIVIIEVEGPLPKGINGGMVGTMVTGVGTPLVGSGQEIVCVVVNRPLGLGPIGPVEGIPIMKSGTDTSPLPTISPWKGSRCAPTMGINGTMNKVGLD